MPTVLRCCAGGDRTWVPPPLVAALLGLACSRRAEATGPAGCAALTSLSRRLKARDAKLQPSFHRLGWAQPLVTVFCGGVRFAFHRLSQVLLVPELSAVSSTCNPQRIRRLACCGPPVCSNGSHLLPLLPQTGTLLILHTLSYTISEYRVPRPPLSWSKSWVEVQSYLVALSIPQS